MQPNFTNKMTWHKKIPFKWFFCLWRALRNKLPTDDRISSFGIITVSRCVCCTIPTDEIIEHIFRQGYLAKTVCKKHGGPTGIKTDNMPLRLILMHWWLQKKNNEVLKLILASLSPLSYVGTWSYTQKGRFTGIIVH